MHTFNLYWFIVSMKMHSSTCICIVSMSFSLKVSMDLGKDVNYSNKEEIFSKLLKLSLSFSGPQKTSSESGHSSFHQEQVQNFRILMWVWLKDWHPQIPSSYCKLFSMEAMAFFVRWFTFQTRRCVFHRNLLMTSVRLKKYFDSPHVHIVPWISNFSIWEGVLKWEYPHFRKPPYLWCEHQATGRDSGGVGDHILTIKHPEK